MNLDTGKFIIITAPHFTAGVVVGERAAPIVGYMTMWSLNQILDYCFKKGWKAELSHMLPPVTLEVHRGDNNA